MNSAAGVASQIPFMPRRAGRTSIVISMNTKEREKARTAETMPLDRAVNIPLAKMLKPMKNNARVQIRFPVAASSYTGLSGRAKMETSGPVAAKETAALTSELKAITFKLVATSFFSFSWFFSP